MAAPCLQIWLLQRQGAVAHLGTPMAWDAHCHLISGCEVSGHAPDLSVPPNGMGGVRDGEEAFEYAVFISAAGQPGLSRAIAGRS